MIAHHPVISRLLDALKVLLRPQSTQDMHTHSTTIERKPWFARHVVADGWDGNGSPVEASS